MTRSTAIRSLPYVWVFAASCCGAWFHWQFFPEVVNGVTRMFGDVRVIPNGFRLLMSVGWWVYFLPILALLFGASSLRFPSLQSASVVSFLASLFLVTYVIYAFLLATPMLLNAVPKLEPPKTSLQPTRDGAFRAASRSTLSAPRGSALVVDMAATRTS